MPADGTWYGKNWEGRRTWGEQSSMGEKDTMQVNAHGTSRGLALPGTQRQSSENTTGGGQGSREQTAAQSGLREGGLGGRR